MSTTVKREKVGGETITIDRYAKDGRYVYSVGREEWTPEDARRVQCASLREARAVLAAAAR